MLHLDEEPTSQRQGNRTQFRQSPGPGCRQGGADLGRDAVLVQQCERQLLADERGRTDLPALRIEHVRIVFPARSQKVFEEVLRRQYVFHPLLNQLGERGRGQFLAFGQDRLPLVGIRQRKCQFRSFEQRQRHLAPLLHAHWAARREGLQDFLFRHADRAQQDCHRYLAAAVDSQVQQVLVVESELKPGPILRLDPGMVKDLAGGMAAPLVVGEDDPWRLQQLRHDHPLRAVDHESSVLGHQRNVAEVHILFLDLLDLARPTLGRVLLVNHHPRLDPQGRHVGLAPPLALAHVEARFAQFVLQAAQLDVTCVADDRERRVEHRLDALVLAFLRRHVDLQEAAVRLPLHLQHVRDRKHFRQLSEIFPDAFFLGIGIRHVHLGGSSI